MNRFIARCTVTALIIGLAGSLVLFDSLAAEQPRTPSDYFVEQWLMGTLGGLIAGPVMERVAIVLYCGPEEAKPGDERVICQEFGTLVFRILFYSLGIPIGVSTGVILDGWVHGIQGNLGATITLSALNGISWMLWAGVINLGADYLASQPGFESLQPWVGPFKALVTIFWPTVMTSFMATVGFQMGATFKDEKPGTRPQYFTSDWSAPLFRLNF